ncbi:MAG TPA: isopropylmalate/homocitrate/citramalate synthase [Saprospirales bacterium]|nr:isopropylmalate/homocitrate/citramalate synthase [Saprospirales bacterium]
MTALDIVQQYYQAFNRQDWEGMLAHLSDNIRHEVNQGEPRIGKDLYRSFLQHMDDCYAETLTDMVFFTEPAGKRVAVEFTVNGIYKKTDGDLVPARGQQYVLPAGAFLEVHNGKITRVTTYYNLPLWIKLVSV